MLKRLMNYFIILFLSTCLPAISFAANPQFVDNKDYQTLPNNPAMLKPVNGKVTVMEFFSFGCPWCYHFDPALEQWLTKKPANVNFERVPVVFEPGWDVYAKGYYVANQLGVADKLVPAIFDAVQKQQMDLTNETAMQLFFTQHGVKQQDFQGAYEFSPGIDAQLAKSNQLMNAYLVYSIPTMVVDGKYKVDNSMAGGNPQKMLQTVEFLVQKELNQTQNKS